MDFQSHHFDRFLRCSFLRANQIYVRHWNKPRIANYLRISIGTDEEMDRLIAFLEQYLETVEK